jgi:hypothetical protein
LAYRPYQIACSHCLGSAKRSSTVLKLTADAISPIRARRTRRWIIATPKVQVPDALAGNDQRGAEFIVGTR